MRVLVTGGRDYNDRESVKQALDVLHITEGPITTIIAGGARGADYWAEWWAKEHEKTVDYVRFPADWNKYKKGAGAIRNQQMIDEGKPDLILAFPGNRGTRDMLQRAKRAGLRIVESEDVLWT